MNYALKIGHRNRIVGVTQRSCLEFSLDGQGLAANVVEVEPNVFSVLLGGEAFEIRIYESAQGVQIYVDGQEYAVESSDPRQWRRGTRGASGAEGRQNIFAPMPGKVIRVLAQPGAAVKPGQGLLVIEAMKMQNEIKSPKEGTVERVNVKEGQAVTAGEALAVIA